MKSFSKFVDDINEAAGDPIKPEQVIKLDAEAQKNLRDASKPSGPPPLLKTKPESQLKRRIRDIMNNTIFTPL